ncbi:MAG: TetR/AcrR family transcriptional regulator [bacterium]
MPESAEPARAIPGPRRTPRQRRSREIVEALLEATRQLLSGLEPESLTTSMVATRAGVSIGSLYRYFPNLDALLAAVHQSDLRSEADLLEEEEWEIDHLPVREMIHRLIDYQISRHRRLLDCYGRFHREQHRNASLARALGVSEVELHIRKLLETHAARLRTDELGHAAFFLARGLSAIVRVAVEEDPAKLGQSSFRDELVALAERYLLDETGTIRS